MTRWYAPAIVVAVVASHAPAADPPVDFGRDVLPILSDACFHCHGPDPATRKAKLRLDTPDGVFRPDDPVVVPGKPADSELVRRVSTADADAVMPPPNSHRTLTPKQIDTLKAWVAQGAKWGKHWAFEPIPKPAGRHSIDRFVVGRLEKERLTPSPPADKERLLRRVALDLTGLPPTLAEVDAFLADPSADAYEKVVDRLLASPRFGERMASDWLDVARYADTHGYQMDRARPMWAYRDWVVKALNENVPFDRFVTCQVAGDLLPNATKGQRLATAFNRLHMQNEEGGIVGEEYRVAYVVDRVNTMGTAFLGLTFECCRCHDHKYDPLSQKDFYSLFAFFQNIDESGQTTYFTSSTPVPTLLLTTDEQDRALAELRTRIAAVQAEGSALREAAKPAFAAWRAATDRPQPRGPVADYRFDGKTAANAVDPKKGGKAHESPTAVDEPGGPASLLDGESGFTFPGVGHFTRADAFSLAVTLKPPAVHPSRAVVVHHSKAPVDAGSRGYELLLEDGHVAFGLHHMWPGDSLVVRTKDVLKPGAWADVVVTHDGSGRASGVRVYVNGVSAAVDVVRDGLTKDITYGGAEPDLAVGYRFRDNGFKGGAVARLRVWDRELAALEVGGRPTDDALFDLFIRTAHPPADDWRTRLHALRDELRKRVEAIPEAMVMKELPAAKPAFVLKRGAYDSPGERVTADTPKALPPFPPAAPRNRLGLAAWLTDPGNPLTARVTVNRAWQLMFGKGLVETADNFGTQGSRPTHPELLDWLAAEFRDGGWDVKRLFKLLAMSATYRQSSAGSPTAFARDPGNDLLARGPSKRLTAEMLRDQALAVSGLLVEQVGGPPVKPYQPAGLWEEIAMGRPRYDQGKGADLHRRSLYTFWKRTVPPPSMSTLDAADRSTCSVRRQSTSTPLQALVLLNDVQFVEAARFVGQRAIKEGGASTPERAAWAFRLVTGRRPTAKEAAVVARLWDEQRAAFAADPASAAKLLAVGEAKADAALAAVDLAAATAVANVLLNHDEAVSRR